MPLELAVAPPLTLEHFAVCFVRGGRVGSGSVTAGVRLFLDPTVEAPLEPTVAAPLEHFAVCFVRGRAGSAVGIGAGSLFSAEVLVAVFFAPFPASVFFAGVEFAALVFFAVAAA
jgi:hypothetical protein